MPDPGAAEYNRKRSQTLWSPDDLPISLLKEWWNLGWEEKFAEHVRQFQITHGLVADGMLGPRTWSRMVNTSWLKQHPIQGKGMWIWRLDHLGRNKGEIFRSLDKMVEAGIKHVLIKLADGTYRMNHIFAAEGYLESFRRRGIEVFPWYFSYRYATMRELRTEVDLHVSISNSIEAPAIVVNAEKGFKDRQKKDGRTVYYPDYKGQATAYMEGLREAAVPLYLSSYCFVKGHRNFAWKQMVGGADVLCPQSYWSVKKRRPVDCVTTSLEQWSEWQTSQVISPSGGCWQPKDKETGKWNTKYHTASDISLFIEHLSNLMCPAATFWLYMARPGASRMTDTQWKAIANTPFWV